MVASELATGMAIHRVSSSSRVWFEFELEFELTFELAHARSILFAAKGSRSWEWSYQSCNCQTGIMGSARLVHLVKKTGSV